MIHALNDSWFDFGDEFFHPCVPHRCSWLVQQRDDFLYVVERETRVAKTEDQGKLLHELLVEDTVVPVRAQRYLQQAFTLKLADQRSRDVEARRTKPGRRLPDRETSNVSWVVSVLVEDQPTFFRSKQQLRHAATLHI